MAFATGSADQSNEAAQSGQEAFHSVIDPVLTELSKDPSFTESYQTIDLNKDATAGSLCWKGELPDWARKAVLDQDTFPITVVSSKYSQADLDRTAEKLRAAWPTSYGDFTGLELNSDRVSATALFVPLDGRPGEPAAAGLVADQPDLIPVTAVRTQEAAPAADWRGDDSSPWKSGGQILLPAATGGYERCSIAAALQSSDGTPRLLSAGHCGGGSGWTPGAAVGTTVYDGDYDVIGTVTVNRSHNSSPEDIMVINPSSGAASRHMFIGNHSNTVPPDRLVAYLGWAATNDRICQNGTSSGTVCNLLVGDPTTWGSWNVSGRSVQNTSGGQAVASGDSGGPLITYGTTQATTYGMNSAGSNEMHCTPPTTFQAVDCGSVGYFIPLGNIISSFSGWSLL